MTKPYVYDTYVVEPDWDEILETQWSATEDGRKLFAYVGHGDCRGCSGHPGITHEPSCGVEEIGASTCPWPRPDCCPHPTVAQDYGHCHDCYDTGHAHDPNLPCT